jgi:cyclopropane fatty-acyl-phospholipid synthase-like methyltransferase
MAKIERGRISGFDGMATHNAAELHAWAAKLEAQIADPKNSDDPRWLQRWAGKLRALAAKKEKAKAHKQRKKTPAVG